MLHWHWHHNESESGLERQDEKKYVFRQNINYITQLFCEKNNSVRSDVERWRQIFLEMVGWLKCLIFKDLNKIWVELTVNLSWIVAKLQYVFKVINETDSRLDTHDHA